LLLPKMCCCCPVCTDGSAINVLASSLLILSDDVHGLTGMLVISRIVLNAYLSDY
jgi:hypothetical protein